LWNRDNSSVLRHRNQTITFSPLNGWATFSVIAARQNFTGRSGTCILGLSAEEQGGKERWERSKEVKCAEGAVSSPLATLTNISPTGNPTFNNSTSTTSPKVGARPSSPVSNAEYNKSGEPPALCLFLVSMVKLSAAFSISHR